MPPLTRTCYPLMPDHKGIVAAGHRLTAEAAEHVLRDGGNAFDAALAGLSAACVTEPLLASLGGGGFMLAQPAGEPVRAYDFFTHTPRQRCPENEMDFYSVLVDFGSATQAFHIGRGSIAVPGLIRGLFDIHRDLGTVPMRILVEPARGYATDGYEVSSFHGYVMKLLSEIFTATTSAEELFASTNRQDELVAEGDQLRLPELADVLDVLSREGADLFYRGEIGQTFAADMEEGGHITRDDLEKYEVGLRPPLALDYGDMKLFTNPPPASGGLLIAFALKLLAEEQTELPGFGSPDHLTRMAHVMGLTESARIDAAISESVSQEAATRFLDPEYLELWREKLFDRPRFGRGTTHLSVIDCKLNVASVSLSNGEGSAYVIPGTGISMNNMLGEEDLHPNGFNHWALDQRLTSMMSPSIGSYREGGVLCTGSGGSNRIRSAILQVLVNLLDYQMSCEEAVAAPRIHYEAGLLSLEGGFDLERIAPVLETYEDHQLFDELHMFFGGAHTTVATTKTDPTKIDHFSGIGDPRRSGVSILV